MSRRGSMRFAAPIALTLTALLVVAPISAAAPGPAPNRPIDRPDGPDSPSGSAGEPRTDLERVDESGIPEGELVDSFGAGTVASDDEVHVVVGGSDGVSVKSAYAETGYVWETTAIIPSTVSGESVWVWNECVTSSGRYMSVVFADRSVTNDDDAFRTAAYAAIIDLDTGNVTELGMGFTIAYYNPGCGEEDTVTLSRYTEDWSGTQMVAVSAATGEVIQRVDADTVVHSAVSLANGEILASSANGIFSYAAGKQPRAVTATPSTAYDLTLDSTGRLAYVTADRAAEAATARVSNVDGRGKPVVLATGSPSELGLASPARGRLVVTGEVDTFRRSATHGLSRLRDARPDAIVSSDMRVVIDEVNAPGFAAGEDVAGSAVLTGHSTETGRRFAFDVTDSPHRVDIVAGGGMSTRTRSVLLDASVARILAMGDAHDPIEDERYCSVPRNDPHNQAYQPKPRQVEWAVDRAVKGQLTAVREQNWRGLGVGGYSPQSVFPPVTLTGGGTMPPQIVLGVLMQESNLWQASRYTGPGNTGNPLIGDFYGSRGNSSIWDIEFSAADCGYGVGQITDGMRLAGHEKPGETSLPYSQQRMIALDYQVNIAKAVQMLGQKWNELAAAGLLANNADATKIENWYFAVWSYNSGFYPYVNSTTPWGVGWTNNPASDLYPISRQMFLSTSQSDASHPQDWPYPEKVIGWAAFGTSVVETSYVDYNARDYVQAQVSSYRTAWWSSETMRLLAIPSPDTFCDVTVNECDIDDYDGDLGTPQNACQRGDFQCWWNQPVVWKTNCASWCGNGFERFPSSYATEASSMASSLPELTRRSSHLANCSPAPTGVVVVDDTTHTNARNAGECTQQATAGSFEFTFDAADAQGSYPAKVDLHQQGGGFNGHFYFSHMRTTSLTQQLISGTWSRDANLNGSWVRVWVHLPDYAAWAQQAAYDIDLGDGTVVRRHLPQRRYQNEWVSLGVFQMKGEPTVTLSNALTQDVDAGIGSLSGFDDIAWDAVGFQQLAGKPDHFVVALGDSYASGENAGDYAAWSDNNGTLPLARNSCHQSANSWTRKAILPGETVSVGGLANSVSPDMDFHNVTCSGAQTENLLPYHSYVGSGPAPENGEGEQGNMTQYSLVSQLDAGYLDTNTTLVTLSIGGNDLRFGDVMSTCYLVAPCRDTSYEDTYLEPFVEGLLEDEFEESLQTTLEQIRLRAPNATIAVTGYPDMFQGGAVCIGAAMATNSAWLRALSLDLNAKISEVVSLTSDPNTIYVDLTDAFDGEGLCGGNGAVSNLVLTTTPGDSGSFFGTEWGISQQSFHPTNYGTDLYAQALEQALAGIP